MSSEGSVPVRHQPRGCNQSASNTAGEDITLMESEPSQLQRIVDVEEAILMKNVLHTRNGKILFGLRREKKCCGPDLNLRFMDLYKKDAIAMYLVSSGFCYGDQKYLRVVALPDNPIGYVKITQTSSKIEASMLKANKEPEFTAEIPTNSGFPETIEVLSVNGSHVVAKIRKRREGRITPVTFQYLSNMDPAKKVLILSAFLYMSSQMGRISHLHVSDLNATGSGQEKEENKKKGSHVEEACRDIICEVFCECVDCDIISCLASLCC